MTGMTVSGGMTVSVVKTAPLEDGMAVVDRAVGSGVSWDDKAVERYSVSLTEVNFVMRPSVASEKACK
jgi:hypothetical protein